MRKKEPLPPLLGTLINRKVFSQRLEIRCPFWFAWVWVCCFCIDAAIERFGFRARRGIWVCVGSLFPPCSGFMWDLGLWDLFCCVSLSCSVQYGTRVFHSRVWNSSVKHSISNWNSTPLGLISKSKIESNGLDLLNY